MSPRAWTQAALSVKKFERKNKKKPTNGFEKILFLEQKGKRVFMKVNELERGTLVEFIKDHFDPEGCNIFKGEKGVVFHPYNYHGDGGGPMVRWFSGGACNVYSGMIKVVRTGEVPD